VAVRIRMKKMGRKHRPFFRICAIDGRNPRDGRVLEELGTYDPMVSETDARALLKCERIVYWLGVGAQPSDKVRQLIKKYGGEGTHLEQQRAARERLAMPKVVPDAGEPVYVRPAEGAAPEEAAPAAAVQGDSAAKEAGGDKDAAGESQEQPASVSE
jgi:small subunit ribosomal protein S16